MTRITALLLALLVSFVVRADELPIFDAHIHYSVGATTAYSPEAALDILKRSGIHRAILSSTPNDGTITLHSRFPDFFVPFLRPYRKTRDLASWSEERQTWYRDPATLPFIESELERGIYRGIGEFHVNGDEVDTLVMRGIVDIAVRRNLWLMAHSDAAAIERLFAFNPKARIIWAHTGMGEPVSAVAPLFEKYPALIGELSFRSGVGSAEWRELFLRYPERFVYGSDTWIPSRWPEVPALTEAARGWLAQLPPEVAANIAYRNGERLFGR